MALAYAQKSATTLILTGRDPKRLSQIVEASKNLGAKVIHTCIDIRDAASMISWIAEIDATNPIDIAILNAGISNFGSPETLDRIQHIVDVNVQGTLNTLFPIIERFKARGRGQIGLMSSLASFKGFKGKGAYCASKAAIRVLGEGLRESLKEHGIKVSVICPGFVKTPLTDHNKFKMPFLISAERAAFLIQKGLTYNKGRISFPWPLALGTWFMSMLPQALSERLSSLLPYK